jgi:hypothetical protein
MTMKPGTNGVNHDISLAPWSVIESFENVELLFDDDAFHSLFNPILDTHAPVEPVKLRDRPNPCVTEEIHALMRTRDKSQNWLGKLIIRWRGQVIKISNEK